ncbi:MAG: hypothetical protein EON58_21430, partial [Alphaproteobacteria bacterium]
MHITLHSSLTDLEESQLRAHGAIIDGLLTQHIHRSHMLVLTPKQVSILRGAIQFGPQNRRALETILRRAQDYQASLRSARAHLSVMPLDAGVELERNGNVISVGPQWLATRIAVGPSLFVENGVNDGRFYRRLIGLGMQLVGGSISNVSIRPYHGGGQSLGAVLEALVGADPKGLCICDRDLNGAVPPFRPNSTGANTYDALIRMGVVGQGTLQATANPFFAFLPTRGWALENYLGPHQLDE